MKQYIDMTPSQKSKYNGGKAEGIEIGKVEGKAEAKIEAAKNALLEGIDINTISIITGLSVTEIEKLKE